MNARPRAASRVLLAGCLSLGLGATVALAGPAVTSSAAVTTAATPSEITVFPPDDPTTPAADQVLAAGTTGFVHQRQGVDGFVWTDYATGASHPLPALDSAAAATVMPAGGDVFAYTDTAAGVLHIGRPDAQTTAAYPLPAGYTVRGVGADGTRAVIVANTSTVQPRVEVLALGADGTATVVPITGLPDGVSVPAALVITDGASHAVVPYQPPGTGLLRFALLDLTTGAATDIPGPPGGTPGMHFVPARGEVVWAAPSLSTGTTVVSMVSQQAVLDGSTTPPATVVLPSSGLWSLAAAGDHLVAVSAPGGTAGHLGSAGKPVLDYSFSGAAPTTLLGSDAGFPVVTPDGAVLAIGGPDAKTSAVHRYAPAAGGGALTDSTVLPLPPVSASTAGLTMSSGFVRRIGSIPQLGGGALLSLSNHQVAPSTQQQDIPHGRLDGGFLPTGTLPCQPAKRCVHSVDGNGYGTSFLEADAAGTTHVMTSVDTSTSFMDIALPFTGGRLLDASGAYQLVDGGSTARQYVIETGQEKVLLSGPITGAALWDNTLWQAPTNAAAGTLTATDLAAYPAPKVVRTLTTGTACRPGELQVSQHWLYWSCGASGPAGVIDLSTGHRIPVPSGQALVGDGFLVQHDVAAGRLTLVDFHTGTAAAAQDLADLPPSGLTDDRSITWAVDRSGGDVAYVAADRSVHVLSTGIPASALTSVVWTGSSYVSPGRPPTDNWQVGIFVDRPVDAWQLTIDDASGAVVHTISGGAVRSTWNTWWDGKLSNGSPAFSGQYTWHLTATAQGVTSAVGGASGSFSVSCGALPFRSYDCDGSPALLAVTPDSQGHWYSATPTGSLMNHGWSDSWDVTHTYSTATSAIVPFGDINGDSLGDVLARSRAGVLTAYLGIGETYFNAESTDIKKVRIGGGWNIYTILAAPGDMTGDGRTDLLARDSSGKLWRYANTGKSSFTARVLLGGGWNTYTRIIGAGDLNGDREGDLLAVDTTGALWMYLADGHGGFRPRVKIGWGWGAYNAVIGVGDLNRDGHNDLVARDRSGVLWRYDGTSRPGAFKSRVKIGWGWGMYAGLY